MVRYTLKNLQHLLQVFKSVSDHFETLCIKKLIIESQIFSKDLSVGLKTRSQDFESCLRKMHDTFAIPCLL